MKYRTKYIIIMAIYIISFTPFSNSIKINGEVIKAERIRSNLNVGTIMNSATTDFFYSSLNTILLNLPAHYGSFISLFSNITGNKLKAFCFSNRFKAPEQKSAGWWVGISLGWLIRFGLLILLALKLKKKEKYTHSTI